MQPEVIGQIGGGLFVLANVIVFWIREVRKHRTWNSNGKDLKEIKDDVKSNNTKIDAVDIKIGRTDIQIAEVKTAVNSQKSQCKLTVQRFDKTIGDHNQAIIDLAKQK